MVHMTNKNLIKVITLFLIVNTQLVSAQERGIIPEKRYKTDRLEQMDKDKDSKVSKDEFISSANAEFERIDLNKDGFITTEELKNFRSLKNEIRNFQKRFENKQ